MKDSQEQKHEAIEYRIKSAIQQTVGFCSVILMSIALVGIIASDYWTSVVASLIVLFQGIFTYGLAMALYEDGRFRRFYSRFRDFDDPPLDEWEEYLEERDAFGGQEVEWESDSE